MSGGGATPDPLERVWVGVFDPRSRSPVQSVVTRPRKAVRVRCMQPERIIAPHTRVAVHCRYDGSWSEGFEIAEAEPSAPASYLLRRLSDGTQLPTRFGAAELRTASPISDHRPQPNHWERQGPRERHDD
jgi:hypothetical protein